MSEPPPYKAGKDADLSTALALTERLLTPGAEDGVIPALPVEKDGLGQNLRYWMWRMGGRKRPELADMGHLSKIFDNYERELSRLQKDHAAQLESLAAQHAKDIDRVRQEKGVDVAKLRAELQQDAERSLLEIQRELAASRERTSKLEQLTNQLQQTCETEVARARNEAAAISEGPLQKALDRVEELERRLKAQQAEHARTLEETLNQAQEAQAQAVAQLRTEMARQQQAAEILIAEMAATEERARHDHAAQIARWEAETQQLRAEAAHKDEASVRKAAETQLAHRTEFDRLRLDLEAEQQAKIAATRAALDAALQEAEQKLAEGARESASLKAEIERMASTHAQEVAEQEAAHQAALQAAMAESARAEEGRRVDLLVAHQAELEDSHRRQGLLENRIRDLLMAHEDESGRAADAHARELAASLREAEDKLRQTIHQAESDRQAAEQAARTHLAELTAEHAAALAEAGRHRSLLEERVGELLHSHAQEMREQTDRHSEEQIRLRTELSAQAQETLQQALDRIASLEAAQETAARWHATELEKTRAAMAETGDAHLRQTLDQLTQAQADRRQLEIRLKEERDGYLRELGRIAERHAEELTRERREAEVEADGHIQRGLDRVALLEAELAEREQNHAREMDAARAAIAASADSRQRQTDAELADARTQINALTSQLEQTKADTKRKLQDLAVHQAEFIKREIGRAQAEIALLQQQAATERACQAADLERVREEVTAIADANLRSVLDQLAALQAEHQRLTLQHAAEKQELADQIDQTRSQSEAGADARLRKALDSLAAVQAERRELAERLARSQEQSPQADNSTLTARIQEQDAELARLRIANLREITELNERHTRALARATAEADARIGALADELARQRDKGQTGAPPDDRARLADQHRQDIERLHREADQQRGELDRRLIEATGRIGELEADLARLRLNHARDLERQGADHSDALTRLRQTLDSEHRASLAASERTVADLRAQLASIEMHQAGQSPRGGGSDTDARLNAALARAMMAEDELRIANNKLELLKDALDAAKARAVSPGPGAADNRFRDAKRAFARHFHPDQGGRGDSDKERIFLEFWPVLDRIEKTNDF
ncbi:hypothetical protein [Magnetospirillum sp. LM-5]|uniref:hypothetical protein n=1 Tax=Magnetospirillum sp. LM-5 TaxID=2681466 RepID=UPI001570F5E6|nr:hypothetical protein [Magnetospirillum sp. LM-5]